jgi:hypothetical protein
VRTPAADVPLPSPGAVRDRGVVDGAAGGRFDGGVRAGRRVGPPARADGRAARVVARQQAIRRADDSDGPEAAPMAAGDVDLRSRGRVGACAAVRDLGLPSDDGERPVLLSEVRRERGRAIAVRFRSRAGSSAFGRHNHEQDAVIFKDRKRNLPFVGRKRDIEYGPARRSRPVKFLLFAAFEITPDQGTLRSR